MTKQRKPPAPRFLARPRQDVPSIDGNPDMVERMREATALCDEPEMIGPAILDPKSDRDRMAKAQAFALKVQALAEAAEARPELPVRARIMDVRRRAKRHHVDLSHELHILEQALDRAQAGGRRFPGGQEARLGRLEELMDHLDSGGGFGAAA